LVEKSYGEERLAENVRIPSYGRRGVKLLKKRHMIFERSLIVTMLMKRHKIFCGFLQYRPDGTNDKTFASGTGGKGFKSRADQTSHTLPTTRHRCSLRSLGPGAKPR